MDIFFFAQKIADFVSYNMFALAPNTHLADAVNFFIYDSIKIIILLLVITQIMTFINIILPVEKIRYFLNTKKLYGLEYFFASLFGAITPFCSCSSIPLFIGFLKGGIPLGITFSFLITSPLINEVALAMFLGIFGLKVTLIYLFSGIILGMIGGFILGKLGLEKYVEDFVLNIIKNNSKNNTEVTKEKKNWKKIWKNSSKEGLNITKKIMPYVLIGIGIGAFIHGYVPQGFFEKYITSDNPFAVPISVVLGIPMYANATSIIPIMESLIDKGVPLGTGLSFMMAVIGLSLPEFLILKKVMKTKLLLIFFGLIGIFIIILGYFFNVVL
ncbi:MAG: permease [Candidatus Gracilibacteria bacterium]|nr:permease [Candidatus Gracilibacteria bacterium]